MARIDELPECRRYISIRSPSESCEYVVPIATPIVECCTCYVNLGNPGSVANSDRVQSLGKNLWEYIRVNY